MRSSNRYGSTIARKLSGSASIEAIATLLLLLLAGICIFSLTITSTSAYKRLYERKDDSTKARIALSFVEMKIRQNDISGAIDIKNNPINNQNALVIHEQYEGEQYDTWIYRDQGKLREAIVLSGETPSNELSLEIIEVDGFEIAYDEYKSLHIKVWKKKNLLESLITLRAETNR